MLTGLSWQLSLKDVVGVFHATVELAMTHFSISAPLKMNDALIFLKVVGFVTDVHSFKAIIALALEFEALLVLALQK